MLDVPDHLLAERKRLGHDRFDEMWEGELHMVPPPSEEHQRIGTHLCVALVPIANEAGLHVRYETGLFDPSYPGDGSYRQPDLVVFDESVRSTRGVEGAARLVIEIRSPGDETFEKQPFWERVGVAEVVVIDRDDKTVRRWIRRGDVLVEAEPAPDGSHRLAALAVTLATRDARLVVTTAGADVVI
jgi:Uma2 family endonuclease